MNEDRNPTPDPPPARALVPSFKGIGCFILLVFWLVMILSAVSGLSPDADKFLSNWWWAIGIGIIVLAILVWSIGLLKHWYPKAAESARTGIVVFVLLPLLLVVFATLFLVPSPEWRINVVRSVFFLAVCLFPALLYYLFITARRNSLLNDYLVNLHRLGLVEKAPTFADASARTERTVRLNIYLQKFEALYGPLDPGLRVGITAADDPLFILSMPPTGPSSAQDSVSSRVIPIFTAATAIPVVLATVLIAIGWLMALPPTGFSELRQATTASQPLREKSEESSPTSRAGSPTAAPMPAQTASEQSSRAPGKSESVTPSATPAAPTQLSSTAQDVATAGQGSLSPAPTTKQSGKEQSSPPPRKGEGVTPSATPVKAPQKKIAGEVKEVSEPAFWSVAFNVNPDPIIYAFLGAYFFSLQMLFRRFVSEDLRKTAYLAVSLRIVLAVIGTWAAITAMKGIWEGVGKEWLLVVGFVIGVFPRIAWQFIQGAWKALMQKSGLSAALPSMESRLPVSDLDGLTVWHEARLEEEDIENIPNMATTEIVDLMLSTRFPPDRIIDWVDQAILFTHLGPDPEGVKEGEKPKNLLRVQGIRTATSLIEAFEAAQIKGRDDSQEVNEILSKALGTQGHIRSFLDAIKTEPNLALVGAWRRMPVEWTRG